VKVFLISRLVVLLTVLSISATLNAAITVDGSQTSYLLGDHIEFLEEKDSALSLEEVMSAQQASRFELAKGPIPNFGQVNSAFWFKINVNHQLPENKQWLIELDFPYFDHIEFYAPGTNGRYSKIITGDTYPFSQRPIKTHSFVFDINLAPKQLTTLFFRIQTTTSLQLPLVLWEPNEFIQSNSNKRYGFGIFYGILLVMIFYNLFIFISVRDISYFYYISYICLILTAQLSINGLAFEYLWPNSPTMTNLSVPLFLDLAIFTAIIFARSFLQIREYSTTLDFILKGLATLAILAAVATLIISSSVALKLAIALNMSVGIALLITSIYGVIKKQRRAYFFLAAWVTLCVGAILISLLSVGLIPVNFFTLYSGQIGIIGEVFILSLALADRINTEKVEKFEAMQETLLASEDRRQAEQQLVYQSLHDPLTGSPNRIFCHQHLQQLLNNSNSANGSVVVVCVQLNNFHDINYTLGYDTGDEVLKTLIAELNIEVTKWPNIMPLASTSKTSSYIAKVEGVCLTMLFNSQTQKLINDTIERLAIFLRKPTKFNEMLLDVGGHIGISICPDHRTSAEVLIRRAMVAVKAAKQKQCLSLIYNEEIDSYSAERLSLTGELKQAIDKNELELYFHPKIDLNTLTVVSMEALLRWNHPERGLLTPDKFIDLAEGTGIITPLTQWVIKHAVAYCSDLQKKGLKLSVAVNISAHNLLEDNFVSQVKNTLEQYQLSPQDLILEMVESAMVEDYDKTIDTLNELKQLGIQLSIDDFGTGYSSLAYLKTLPVHELKIDRSFISGIVNSEDDRLIVEATLSIAHQLNLNVVAEGIEDKPTMELLIKMGCDIAQGYFFSRPMAAKKFTTWLIEAPWSRGQRD